MNKTTDKPEIVVSLENLFSEINKHLFGGELELPAMILQPERRFDFNFVGDTYHFVIGGRFVDFKTVGEMHQKFLHEMVHVQLADKNSNSSNYHNSSFLDAALKVGLHVGRNRTIGWGFTSFATPKDVDTHEAPSEDAVELRKKCFEECSFDSDEFAKAKKFVQGLRAKNGRSKQYFLKYVCKCEEPHNSVRSGRRPDSLQIFCGDCGYSFICVNSSGEPVKKDQEHVHILEFAQGKFGEGLQKSV